eukprot:COSAG02_NODE_809_length_16922_cov_11.295013_9_plen_103_part_00
MRSRRSLCKWCTCRNPTKQLFCIQKYPGRSKVGQRRMRNGLFRVNVGVASAGYRTFPVPVSLSLSLQGIASDKKPGWRMGIETLNPSNFNESQFSLGDPVRS